MQPRTLLVEVAVLQGRAPVIQVVRLEPDGTNSAHLRGGAHSSGHARSHSRGSANSEHDGSKLERQAGQVTTGSQQRSTHRQHKPHPNLRRINHSNATYKVWKAGTELKGKVGYDARCVRARGSRPVFIVSSPACRSQLTRHASSKHNLANADMRTEHLDPQGTCVLRPQLCSMLCGGTRTASTLHTFVWRTFTTRPYAGNFPSYHTRRSVAVRLRTPRSCSLLRPCIVACLLRCVAASAARPISTSNTALGSHSVAASGETMPTFSVCDSAMLWARLIPC